MARVFGIHAVLTRVRSQWIMMISMRARARRATRRIRSFSMDGYGG